MAPNQDAANVPDVQATVHRLALGLDSFLVNGLQYGVIHRLGPDFLQDAARNLRSDLVSLKERVPDAPAPDQARIREILTALQERCEEIIAAATGLGAFRTSSLTELHAAVPHLLFLRAECAQRIQELETCFRTAQPFDEVRPAASTAAVNRFFANLESALAEEWAIANAEACAETGGG